jgi:hypothetical protein
LEQGDDPYNLYSSANSRLKRLLLMEQCSLHPLDLGVVDAYVAALNGDSSAQFSAWANRELEQAQRGYQRAKDGDEGGAIAVGFGLAKLLSEAQPSFFHDGLSLTNWEARIDRGIGMMIRPPSRLFIDAGLDTVAARTMPIRLDLNRGIMGGAFVPAHLIDQLDEQLDTRLERLVRRMVEAELDAVPMMAMMLEAVQHAKRAGLGLLEAIDAISPDAPEAWPPGANLILADKRRIEPELKKRLEQATKPPKKPGFISRLRQNREGT